MSRYACSECGHTAARWFGRCPQCSSWGSAIEPGAAEDDAARDTIVSLDAAGTEGERLATGIGEVDRVLGGGLVGGSVVLLAGEPGIGKSTLVLQLLQGLVANGSNCLLVTGEESVSQVALRARRLGVDSKSIRALASTSLTSLLGATEREHLDAVVVDSIQTLEDPSLEQTAGSPLQVRQCATHLVRMAKRSGTIVILVGHVTKEGTVAGPKTLEHVVDVVISLEGERSGALRLLRAAKNRFGSCEETGVFVMEGRGLEAVPDPSALFLADRRSGVPGSAIFPSLEGSRPLLVELQALVAQTNQVQPRRVALSIESRRLAMLLGVLDKRAGLGLGSHDVFVSAAGGYAVRETASDLALCLSLYSAHADLALDPAMVAVGEVGLGGEIRRVPGIERRLSEALRLGFKRAIVPRDLDVRVPELELIEVADLRSATDLVASARAPV
jgi:DNA repair protein RadA/Sms